MEAPDDLLGKGIWHEGLGIGVVEERGMRGSPVYDVRFEGNYCRKILLRSARYNWRLVDQPNAEALAVRSAPLAPGT